ncbi:MAG: PleD family two-component system response regulator [Bacteroidales bacterium]
MKAKILLVDDKNEFRTLLKVMLEKEFEIRDAFNGANALEVLNDGFEPDLIVTDLMMPDVDGKSFVTQLKSSGLYKDIPVIVLSSIDKSMEKIELLKLGAEDYLIKPFNPSELLVRIENVLARRSA